MSLSGRGLDAVRNVPPESGSAFGEMSPEDQARYDLYWDDAAKTKGLSSSEYYEFLENKYYFEQFMSGAYDGFDYSAWDDGIKCLEGGKGFETFEEVKKYLGSAGKGKAWHHFVEQNQIENSGFNASNINNTKNLVSVESGFTGSIHGKISGEYSSIQPYAHDKVVRQWLSGKSFEEQFLTGISQLEKYGTLIPTSEGWIFIPFK